MVLAGARRTRWVSSPSFVVRDCRGSSKIKMREPEGHWYGVGVRARPEVVTG